jgi:putative SOS response-associated peptidase YedK
MECEIIYLTEIHYKVYVTITMCGRYTLTVKEEALVKRFKVKDYQGKYTPRYNIAPTQYNPVVSIIQNERAMVPMKWGLIPHWAKEEAIGYKMINARIETIAEKPSFKRPLLSQRCLVPADGYYEWSKLSKPGKRPPFRVVLKSREIFAFAGLWDSWENEEGDVVLSYTIITTEADELVRKIHPRMPVILRPENEDTWIDPTLKDLKMLMKILTPYPAKYTEMYEVSSIVGRANIDKDELIQPVATR